MIMRRHYVAVWRVAFLSVREETAAEELAQDTFLRAYGALAGWRGEASLRTWLATICRRLCIDRARLKHLETVTALADCEGCSAFAAGLVELGARLARLPRPEPPAGAADRAIARFRAELAAHGLPGAAPQAASPVGESLPATAPVTAPPSAKAGTARPSQAPEARAHHDHRARGRPHSGERVRRGGRRDRLGGRARCRARVGQHPARLRRHPARRRRPHSGEEIRAVRPDRRRRLFRAWTARHSRQLLPRVREPPRAGEPLDRCGRREPGQSGPLPARHPRQRPGQRARDRGTVQPLPPSRPVRLRRTRNQHPAAARNPRVGTICGAQPRLDEFPHDNTNCQYRPISHAQPIHADTIPIKVALADARPHIKLLGDFGGHRGVTEKELLGAGLGRPWPQSGSSSGWRNQIQSRRVCLPGWQCGVRLAKDQIHLGRAAQDELARDPISSTCWIPAFKPSTRLTSPGSTRTPPDRLPRRGRSRREADQAGHDAAPAPRGRPVGASLPIHL
jgi:RNA polymerase sigma factor (sigma-70 family)